jgi:hypothetical protein
VIDSVARFHLRNGACFFRLNYMGNSHGAGLAQSAGLMANYMYECPASVIEDWSAKSVDTRAVEFERSGGDFPCGSQVLSILDGHVVE